MDKTEEERNLDDEKGMDEDEDDETEEEENHTHRDDVFRERTLDATG